MRTSAVVGLLLLLAFAGVGRADDGQAFDPERIARDVAAVRAIRTVAQHRGPGARAALDEISVHGRSDDALRRDRDLGFGHAALVYPIAGCTFRWSVRALTFEDEIMELEAPLPVGIPPAVASRFIEAAGPLAEGATTTARLRFTNPGVTERAQAEIEAALGPAPAE